MEARLMPGCVRCPAHNIQPHYLASSTNIFSENFVRSLANDLEATKELLARELRFSETSVYDGLFGWCKSPGATVFVLVCVLGNLGRVDCVQKIEQYIQSHVMQIFLKVEEAITDCQQWHTMITNCEYNLLQILESALGESLVYYEITGPGSWVTWTTLAKELKGQQLTLLHHSQPFPGTQAALFDQTEPDTELKQVVVTQNIPAITDTNEETFMKVQVCTQIEDLKYSHDPSIQVSNSNNLTLSGSFTKERTSFGSLIAEGPSLSHQSLDTTGVTFTVDRQPQVKVLVDGKQNMPEYAQVPKYFPDKLLYSSRSCKGDNEGLIMEPIQPMEVLRNVPHLSLLESGFSSVVTNTQEEKQNNLNCSAPVLVKLPMDYRTVPKTFHCGLVESVVNVGQSQEKLQGQISRKSLVKTSDPVINTSVHSETDMAECPSFLADDSVFTQEKSAQVIYGSGISLARLQTNNKLLINSNVLESKESVQCGHSVFVTASPKERHNQRQITRPSLISVGHQQEHHTLQQHTFSDVLALELMPQQLQQRKLDSPQMAESASEILCASEDENDKPSPALMQQLFYQVMKTQTHDQHYQHHQVNSLDENSLYQETSNWNTYQENQTILMKKSQYQLLKQMSHGSQQETQPSPPPFLKPTASPYLICHTPPPGFPDGQTRGDNQNMSAGIGQGPITQSYQCEKASSNLELDPGNQYLGQSRHETNMETSTDDDYMTMLSPVISRNTGLKLSSMKSHRSFEQGTTLQNLDFSDDTQVLRTQSHVGTVFAPNNIGGSTDGKIFSHCDPSAAVTESQTVLMTSRPFNPAPPFSNALRTRINISMTAHETLRKDTCESSSTRKGFCNSANNLPRSESLPSDNCQAVFDNNRQDLDTELSKLVGWCPDVNGNNIQQTMEKFKLQDGNFIIWLSRRHQQFMITVSHFNQLFHFLVREINSRNTSEIVYYLFDGGYKSRSLLDLVQHYREKDIRIAMQEPGNRKSYIEHIKLLYPLKVRLVKRKREHKI